MSRTRPSQIIILQYIRFLLPLLLLALGFWAVGKVITLQTLNQPSSIRRGLIANTELAQSSTMQVTSIDIEIDRSRNQSVARVNLASSTLQELEFKFASVKPAEIEAILAQELELSPKTIQELAKYEGDR